MKLAAQGAAALMQSGSPTAGTSASITGCLMHAAAALEIQCVAVQMMAMQKHCRPALLSIEPPQQS